MANITGGAEPAEVAPKEPAVPVRRSITPDYLICLEDGRKFKSLKRHLRTKYNMSPEDYRAKWNLPKDYPMVAPELRPGPLGAGQADGPRPRRPPGRAASAASALSAATSRPAPVEERRAFSCRARDSLTSPRRIFSSAEIRASANSLIER